MNGVPLTSYLFLFLLQCFGTNQEKSDLFGIDFGDPVLNCKGRGRICRIEKIRVEQEALPDWVEAVGRFYREQEGMVSFYGILTSKGERLGLETGEIIRYNGVDRFGVELPKEEMIFQVTCTGRSIQLQEVKPSAIPAQKEKSRS